MPTQVLAVLLRAAVAYVYLLILVRITGKRVIKEGTPFDLIVALIVSDFPDDMIWGEVPLAQGLVAMGSLMLLHVLVDYAAYRSIRFNQLVGSGPSPVIKSGKPVHETRDRERINEQELAAMLRLQEIDQRSEVQDAYLEPTGMLTVKRREEAKPAEKRDLDALREMLE